MKVLASILTLLVLFTATATAQTWDPEMQLKVKAVGVPRVSPDGKRVVYTVNEAVMTPDKSEFVTQIWLANIATKQNTQLTFGEKSSTNPKWSPDGNWLAFTSNRKDNRNQLYLLSMNGGEAEPLTDGKSAVANFAWSPDGRSIALTMTDPKTEEEEKNDKGKNDFRWVDENVKLPRLYVIPVAKDANGKREPRKLTTANYQVGEFDWSADSSRIAFSHSKSPVAASNTRRAFRGRCVRFMARSSSEAVAHKKATRPVEDLSAYRMQRGREKLQLGTPSLRICSAFFLPSQKNRANNATLSPIPIVMRTPAPMRGALGATVGRGVGSTGTVGGLTGGIASGKSMVAAELAARGAIIIDADVLARLIVERKAPARLDHQGRGVDGFAAYLDDSAAQFPCRPQRVRQLEVVVGQQWCRDPRGDRAQRRAVLGDRRVVVAHPPRDAGAREDVERPGPCKGPGRDRLVLEERTVGEAQAGGVVELPSIDLAPCHGVHLDLGKVAEVRAQALLLVHGPDPRSGVTYGAVLPAVVPGHCKVGPGRTETAEDVPVEMRVGHHIVGVDEREVLAPREVGADVARRTQPGVGTAHDADTGVAAGVLAHDPRSCVGGPVVDDDDLEVRVRLTAEARQTDVDVALHLIDGDDHAEQIRHPTPTGARRTAGGSAEPPRGRGSTTAAGRRHVTWDPSRTAA